MPKGEVKLLFPSLAGFYETMLPIAATFVRIVVGIMFLVHVSGKFKAGAAAVAANILAKNGIEPALMWAYIIMFLESVGGDVTVTSEPGKGSVFTVRLPGSADS